MGQGLGVTLRRAAALVVILVAGAAAIPAYALAAGATVSPEDTLESALVSKINQVRTAHGLRPVRAASRLGKAADRHSSSLALVGYFRHELFTPLRATNWTSYSHWIHWYWPGPGYTSWSAGENLAWGGTGLGAREIVRMWMNSAGHRANLLARGWRNIGVSAVRVFLPLGYFAGQTEVKIVVAEFGRRSA
jgi:uncharacterized protein YkwD